MAKLILQAIPATFLFSRNFSTALKESIIKTAGIIVIGDEILKGAVVDTNSSYMTKRLHMLGVKVQKISVIGDTLDEISGEVKEFSKRYNYVITTGGIGPTHDDVTFEAVAKAFNEEIILHPELVKICTEFYNTTDTNAPGMKLARIPKSAKLTFVEYYRKGTKVNYPNVSVDNVYMFPGIPQLFQKSFDVLAATLFKTANRFYTKNIYFNVTEDKIAEPLGRLEKEFPGVLVGSYPRLFHSAYKVKVTIESTQEESTTKAYNKLLQIVPEDSIVQRN